jgi:phage-related protein (TIGR01555 family)
MGDNPATAMTKMREDGWTNALTGLGLASTDKRQSTRFRHTTILPDKTLTALYRGAGLTRRIINLPATEMTRNWFTINGDDQDKVLQKLEELSAQEAYTDAMVWARLYGGAVIFMGINDGGKAEEPVNVENIKEVWGLTVFDKTDVVIVDASISRDPNSPFFGKPTIYEITPITGGTSFKVHASRLIRFDGAKIPNQQLHENNGWHDSVMQSIYEQLRQIGGVYDNAEFIVEDFVQTIIKVDNLLQMIASGQDDQVKQRLNLIDLSKHVANTILLDAKEDYAKHSSTVTGLDTLLDRFMMYVSSVTGIPVTLLMGRSPAGQNATGESDIRMWYDSIRSAQRAILRPRLETLIEYCFKATGGEPETWSIEFNPLWEMTEDEKANVYKTNAEGDQIYIVNGVVSAAEIARYRFGGQSYNPTPPTIEQDDLDEQENAAKLAEAERQSLQAEAEAAAKAAAAE